jgi:hypothetical protein
MVVRLLPTIKLEVQFLDLLQTLKQRQTIEINTKKMLPSSSSTHGAGITVTHQSRRTPAAVHVLASSSSTDNTIDHVTKPTLSISTPANGRHHAVGSYCERSTPKVGPPLKNLKREAKHFPISTLKFVHTHMRTLLYYSAYRLVRHKVAKPTKTMLNIRFLMFTNYRHFLIHSV